VQTLRGIREKIATLELEKVELLAELEDLREKAETKAGSLEDEVAQLREEAEELKKILDTL
jgi:chromosome segregation ATPase